MLAAAQTLKKGQACEKVVIDCSHGNSSKIHTNQPIVCDRSLRYLVRITRNLFV